MSFVSMRKPVGQPYRPYCRQRQLILSGAAKRGYSYTEHNENGGTFVCEGAPYMQALWHLLQDMRRLYVPGCRLALNTDDVELVFDRVSDWDQYSLTVTRAGRKMTLKKARPHDEVLPLLSREFDRAVRNADRVKIHLGAPNGTH